MSKHPPKPSVIQLLRWSLRDLNEAILELENNDDRQQLTPLDLALEEARRCRSALCHALNRLDPGQMRLDTRRPRR